MYSSTLSPYIMMKSSSYTTPSSQSAAICSSSCNTLIFSACYNRRPPHHSGERIFNYSIISTQDLDSATSVSLLSSSINRHPTDTLSYLAHNHIFEAPVYIKHLLPSFSATRSAPLTDIHTGIHSQIRQLDPHWKRGGGRPGGQY